MSTLVVVQLLAIVVLLASSLETFRARPWWPQPVGRSPDRPPPRGSAPRQRRWLHAGLASILVGNVLSMSYPGDGTVWAVAIAALVLGVAMVVVGLVRRPSEDELARYEDVQRQRAAEGPDPG